MSRRKAEFAPSEVPFIARKGRSAGDENLVLVDSDLPIADKKKRSLGKQPHFNQQRSYVASQPQEKKARQEKSPALTKGGIHQDS